MKGTLPKKESRTMPSLDELVAEACRLLGVTDLGHIGAPGGQKAVRKVQGQNDVEVLKVVALSSAVPAALIRAEREVAFLRSLNCPNVVSVNSDLVRIGARPDAAAWLEELLSGQDLSQLLGAQWSWADARALGIDVAEGLAGAHVQGVVHRDLSPNNVRRLSSGSFKVMDFGFARFTLRSGVTVHGQPGTPGFMSPEHLNPFSGAPVPASDVFAVGVLMYTALTGKVPIPHVGDDLDYARRLSTASMVDIATERPDLPVQAVEAIRRMLHAQPARRHRDGAMLADALRRTP
jgi:eukaryotic-like serine/threonine-protein kinase